MKSTRRIGSAMARGLCMMASAITPFAPAQAQGMSWPSKPISLVLPYAPGGTIDIQGRLLASGLSTKLGQAVVARNMPGATGAIAMDFVARSAPDGYTLIFASSAQTTSLPLTEKVNYRLEDFAPVSASGRGSMILAINTNVPAQTLREFIDYAPSIKGGVSYGSSGSSSVGHLAGALFLARAGINGQHVPYKGGGPAMTDLLGGQIPMLFGNSGEVMANSSNGRLRILAVSTAQRMRQLPDTPAVSEVLPGFEMTAWQGTLAPARTPREIIDTISRAIQALSRDPAVIERLTAVGVEPTTTTPEQMAELIRAEQSVYGDAVRAAGLGHP